MPHANEPVTGGIYVANDETGDCRRFTDRLAALCAKRGVTFRFGTSIRALRRDGAKVSGVETGDGVLAADAVVVALGSYSPLLLAPLGLHLPVYPLKGYSITLPV